VSAAEELLADLAARGVSIRIEGSRLRLRPRSALTEELINRLRAASAELLALLLAVRRPAAPPPLEPTEWWVLCALAEQPKLSRAGLGAHLPPASRPALEQALAAIVRRREACLNAEGGLELNIC
jgi:hypothetical protein